MEIEIAGLAASGGGGGGDHTLTDQSPTPDVVRIGDGTNQAALNVDGSFKIPTGAATSAKQDTGNTSLSSIDTKATASNSSLASIDGKTPSLGQAVAASSVPVVLPAAQITALTPPTSLQPQPDVSASGTLGALNDSVILATAGESTSIFEITASSLVGTIIIESSNNAFSTSTPVATIYLNGLATQSASWVNPAVGSYSALTAGFKQIRIRVSAYTSGSATVLANTTLGNRIQVALQGNPDNLKTLAHQGPRGTGAQAWLVDGSAVTQPVSAASLPLPTGAATETTLGALNGKFPALGPASSVPVQTSSYVSVRQLPQVRWNASFSDASASGTNTTALTTVRTGSGQTVSQSNGNLLITGGTTANADTIIRSTTTMMDAMVMRYNFLASQRILNTNLYIELVDLLGDSLAFTMNSATSITITFPSVNPFTTASVGQSFYIGAITGIATGISGRYPIASVSGLTVTLTVAGFTATGSGTLSAFGWNYYQILYTGVSASSTSFDAQRRGWNSGFSTPTTTTTAALINAALQVEDTNASFSDTSASSALSGTTPGFRSARTANLPANDVPLYVQIRCVNGTTAPASSTTWTLGYVTVENYVPQQVAITGVKTFSTPTNLPISGAVSVSAGTASIGTVLQLGGATGSSPGTTTLTTTASTITAPANSLGFVLQNQDSTIAIRYRIGATAATNSGQRLLPTQDTGFIQCGANISIVSESGTPAYDIQWVVR